MTSCAPCSRLARSRFARQTRRGDPATHVHQRCACRRSRREFFALAVPRDYAGRARIQERNQIIDQSRKLARQDRAEEAMQAARPAPRGFGRRPLKLSQRIRQRSLLLSHPRRELRPIDDNGWLRLGLPLDRSSPRAGASLHSRRFDCWGASLRWAGLSWVPPSSAQPGQWGKDADPHPHGP